MPDKKPTGFRVDYYIIGKTGSKSRTQMTTGINQIGGAQSESAVVAYLRKKHNAADITIMSLEWKY